MDGKWKILFFLLYILAAFTFDALHREVLYNVSIPIQLWIQPKFQFLMPLIRLFTLIGSDLGMVSVLIVAFNYTNTFSSFILITVYLISSYCVNMCKMIYRSPRPYWSSEQVIPFSCEGGWGHPSGHSLLATAFYLSFWKVVFIGRQRKWSKTNIFLFACFITVICLSRILLGVHSLDQILFAIMIGFGIYFCIFELGLFPSDDATSLKLLLTNKWKYSIISLIMVSLSFIPFYYSQGHEEFKRKIDQIISERCPNVPYSRRFELEALMTTFYLILIIPALYGLHLEFSRIFQSDETKWIQSNINLNLNQEMAKTNLNMPIRKANTQWNKTPHIVSMIRQCIIFLFFAIFMIPYYFISYNHNYICIVVIKLLLPSAYTLVVSFSYGKIILRKLKLTNDESFKMD